MEKQIIELYIKYGLDPIHYTNMTNDLFRLFNVSGRSEQLFCTCKDYNWVNATEDSGNLYCTKCELPVQNNCH